MEGIAMMQLTVEAVLRNRETDALYSVPASGTVADAVETMTQHDIGAVLVMTEDGLVGGIFSERDLLTRVVAVGRDPKTTPISLVMTRDVRFTSPATPIEAALALMYVQRRRHLLVIDGPKVYGLISMRDLVYQLVHYGQGRFAAEVRAAASAANN